MTRLFLFPAWLMWCRLSAAGTFAHIYASFSQKTCSESGRSTTKHPVGAIHEPPAPGSRSHAPAWERITLHRPPEGVFANALTYPPDVRGVRCPHLTPIRPPHASRSLPLLTIPTTSVIARNPPYGGWRSNPAACSVPLGKRRNSLAIKRR